MWLPSENDFGVNPHTKDFFHYTCDINLCYSSLLRQYSIKMCYSGIIEKWTELIREWTDNGKWLPGQEGKSDEEKKNKASMTSRIMALPFPALRTPHHFCYSCSLSHRSIRLERDMLLPGHCFLDDRSWRDHKWNATMWKKRHQWKKITCYLLNIVYAMKLQEAEYWRKWTLKPWYFLFLFPLKKLFSVYGSNDFSYWSCPGMFDAYT